MLDLLPLFIAGLACLVPAAVVLVGMTVGLARMRG